MLGHTISRASAHLKFLGLTYLKKIDVDRCITETLILLFNKVFFNMVFCILDQCRLLILIKTFIFFNIGFAPRHCAVRTGIKKIVPTVCVSKIPYRVCCLSLTQCCEFYMRAHECTSPCGCYMATNLLGHWASNGDTGQMMIIFVQWIHHKF